MTIYTVLLDFAIAGIFMLIGQLIRAKVKFVQSSFIPASLIAGLIGLVLGPAILDVLPLSGEIGSYAGALVVIVFASIGINGIEFSKDSVREEVSRIGEYTFYKFFTFAIQFCIPMIITIFILKKIDPQVNNGFGLVLPAGFYGGHGTAAAVGESFSKLGWEAGGDLAMTSATVGILTGVFGGLFFIKMATEKGYTEYVKNFSSISNDLKTGLIPKENRKSMGEETISSVSLSSLGFHIALLITPAGIGYLINDWLSRRFTIDLPTFTIAFLLALVMFFLLGGSKRKGVYEYVDGDVMNALGSAATDFVVFFGIASIKLDVVLEYFLPFALLMITGIITVSVSLLYFGPRMNKRAWFERSIFVYGYSTGVYAIGLTLLRIVDPENKSKTLNDTAIIGALLTPFEMFAWAAGPAMLLNGKHWYFIGIFGAITIISFVFAKTSKLWYSDKFPKANRIELED